MASTPPTTHQRRILADLAAGRSLDLSGRRFGLTSKTGLAMSRRSLLRRGWITANGEISQAGRDAIGERAPNTMTEPTYDPTCCVTAAELRAIGVPVPAHIPDCGWIPRGSMQMKSATPTSTPEEISQGVLSMNLETIFTQPFRWIELKATITK
jgi:hypothetical protein